MKKIALLALAATVATAQANTCNSSVTGFYLGAGLGLANTNVKYDYSTQLSATGVAGNAVKASSDTGKMGLLYGLMGGYNMQLANNVVVGAELYLGGDSTKVKTHDSTGSGISTATGKSQVKRTLYYGLAPRIGYMITPHVLAYVRLGIEGGKYKAEFTPDAGAVDNINKVLVAAGDPQLSGKTVTTSKNRINFAPGVGADIFVSKNVFMRMQYTYLFGPTINLKYGTGNAQASGVAHHFSEGDFNQKFKVSQHAVTFAVGYKF